MDLSQLATILRENGDQVLNGLSKLSLSTKLLKELNDSFGLIIEEREALGSTFQVVNASNSKVELLLDLQFLHDFIQRTIGLKLIDEQSSSCDQANISKFKNLKLLELRKIPISQVSGLQSLRNQLQYIICVRCLKNLKDLFVECGQDKSTGFVWSELREAVLSYNNLDFIDNSLEYVPWLQILDLSHNSITNAQPLICLPNLKHLNLGFNHLESVPIFKRESARNLQVLILKSNYIEDLTGLLLLDNLVTLDLSCNCLVDHISLKTLPHLAALQWLSLEGNPLSFHPNHRSISAQYLHSNTATVKFILDRSLLSKSEKLLTGTLYSAAKLTRMYHTSISSNISDMTNSSEVTTIAASELTRSQSFQRGRKVRDAVISEKEECPESRDDQGDIINPELLASFHSTSSIIILSDHVETQRQIEHLRHQYGKDWLRNQSGSLVQDILGLEKTAPRLSSTPYEEEFLIHAPEMFEKQPEINTAQIVLDSSTDVTSDVSANNTFVTASENSFFEDRDMITSVSPSISSDEEQNEDGEEHLYLAQFNDDEIFIVLTDKYIKERDTSTGRIRAKWLLEIIISCEITSSNPCTLLLEFDTVRRNMKQREYVLEEVEAKNLSKVVNQIISQRPLSALNQTVFSCMKCSTQFSQDKDTTLQIAGASNYLPGCPTCHSAMVYEVEDELTPTNRNFNGNGNGRDRPESPSECSIASETENNPLLAQIHVMADVHMDSTANNSAESVQESNSSHITLDNLTRKYESDIEVISNPSQSSIEVLDDHMRPGRKRSSEERKTIIAPSLVTIPDVITPITTLTGLTESSSSSSFTESVCTTYDTQTHTSRPASGLEVRPSVPEEKIEVKSSIISSIIGGLFSGPKTGTKSNVHSDDLIVFNDDFINIDHRIKYYLYQHVFEDEHENFVWLLRCFVLNLSWSKPVDACVVVSTHRVYILVIKEENMGPELIDWITQKQSYTIDRLHTVFALPWKQGIGLEIKNAGNTDIKYLCLLQDIQRTSNFLTFLTDNPLPDSCDLVHITPERPMLNLQHVLLSHHSESTNKDTSLCILSIFSKCAIAENNITTFGVFLVTAGDLILLEDTLWLLPESNQEPKIFNSQPISNLLEVILDDLSLEFHFLDEVASVEEIWTIKWPTVDTVNTVISAVRVPWEEIFSVPLQVNHKVHSG